MTLEEIQTGIEKRRPEIDRHVKYLEYCGIKIKLGNGMQITDFNN